MPADVLYEQSLLGSLRLFPYVDELENVNVNAGDSMSSDMYFEF